jgi:hypothetical protein
MNEHKIDKECDKNLRKQHENTIKTNTRSAEFRYIRTFKSHYKDVSTPYIQF